MIPNKHLYTCAHCFKVLHFLWKYVKTDFVTFLLAYFSQTVGSLFAANPCSDRIQSSIENAEERNWAKSPPRGVGQKQFIVSPIRPKANDHPPPWVVAFLPLEPLSPLPVFAWISAPPPDCCCLPPPSACLIEPEPSQTHGAGKISTCPSSCTHFPQPAHPHNAPKSVELSIFSPLFVPSRWQVAVQVPPWRSRSTADWSVSGQLEPDFSGVRFNINVKSLRPYFVGTIKYRFFLHPNSKCRGKTMNITGHMILIIMSNFIMKIKYSPNITLAGK